MKKVLLLISICSLAGVSDAAFAQSTPVSQGELTDIVQQIIPKADAGTGDVDYVSIAKEIQFWVFALVGVIAMIYIIWAGAKLLWAPGNMEQVSTAMKSLGYIVLGLALIPFAWFIISFLTNLNIN